MCLGAVIVVWDRRLPSDLSHSLFGNLLMSLRFHLTRSPLLAAVVALVVLVQSGCNVQTRSSSPGPSDADAPEEYSETASGLKYRILRKGNEHKPNATDTVVVDYVGMLDSNVEFDNSYRRSDPSSFSLRSVVPGWTEGMQLIGEGGMIDLLVPPELGYGDRTLPGIPMGSTLHFQVELIEIK